MIQMTPIGLALCAVLGASPCDLSHLNHQSLFGCPVTLRGTVTFYCPPPPDRDCDVIATYSLPAYPNGVVYYCRVRNIPVS